MVTSQNHLVPEAGTETHALLAMNEFGEFEKPDDLDRAIPGRRFRTSYLTSG